MTPRALRDPHAGTWDETFDCAEAADIHEAAVGLRAHQPAWAALPATERAAALLRLRDGLADSGLAQALERDTGRRRIARTEVGAVVGMLTAWAAQAAPEALQAWRTGRANAALRHRPAHVPFGLVGVISPWNFPLLLTMIDAVPALLAGCAVIAKPSEITPRFAEPLREAIGRAGLAGVLTVLPGAAEAGEALVEASDCVCFTGSVETGRRVAVAAGRRLIPAYLELGGKDPLIVTADADIGRAVTAALRGAVVATGQACQSIERIYVARAVHDEFVARLAEAARAVGINWPNIGTGELGPIIAERQATILQAQIDDAVALGARILTGGMIESHGGLWLRPTVVTGVTHAMTLMREETFGPVMPVMPFDTIDEAVALANESAFGLSAAVFAGTLEAAEAIGRRLHAGAVSLNDAALTALFHEAPKQSFGCSGLGPSRMGADGLTRFTRVQSVIAQTAAPMPLSAFAEGG